MRKFILLNLLPIMFLVGAASGFLLSNAGWWGLHVGAQDLERVYSAATQNVPQPVLDAVQQAYAKARGHNRDASNILLALAALASLFFCVTAWLTYRQTLERRKQTKQLDAEHTRFRTLFENAEDAILLLNRAHIVDANPAALALFESPSILALASGGFRVLLPYEQPDGTMSHENFGEKMAHSLAHGSQRFEWYFQSQNGRQFPTEVAMDVAHLPDSNVVQLTIRDITQRKQTENSMRLANQAFENSLEGITITDAKGTILTVNRAFATITGYSPEEVVGRNPNMLSSGRQTPEFYRDMWHSLKEHGQWQGEIWNIRKDGEIYPQWLNISRVWNEHGEIMNYVGVFSDISERKSAEARILHQVYHDTLTDLPNRALFADRLNQLLALAIRHPSNNLAVMFVDLDLFKQINDTMGHDAGDQLLQQTAIRLKNCTRETDTVARMGGDEFAIILSKISEADDAATVAQKILASFEEPFLLNGEEVTVSLSIGISLFPGDGLNAETLVKNADLAMYRAKGAGGSWYELYDEQLGVQAGHRLTIETGLRKALARGEMLLHYQPQFDCRSGELIGYEALLRWQHSERGLLTPEAFMAVAEETALIVPIGVWVLQTACTQAQAWREQSMGDRLIAVNLSARQFYHTELLQHVKSALQTSGLPATCLELEVTESVVMQKLDSSVQIMRELSALGVKFSIGGFGTGYSLLGHLKKLPISALKIDRSFIRDIVTDDDNAIVVGAMVAMSRELGIRVVAEGIEEESQLNILKEHPGIAAQGYLLGRPVAQEVMSKLVGERRAEAVHSITDSHVVCADPVTTL